MAREASDFGGAVAGGHSIEELLCSLLNSSLFSFLVGVYQTFGLLVV